MDPETRYGTATAIQKDPIRWRTMGNEGLKYLHGSRPQWALALFATFADDPHEQRSTVKVLNRQLGRLVSAGSGVVEEQ
jgi:hypothetical protein